MFILVLNYFLVLSFLLSCVLNKTVCSLSSSRPQPPPKRVSMPPQHDPTVRLSPTTASTSSTATPTTNLIAIRHGTSVSNEWMTGSNAWFSPTFCDDLKLVDAPLSSRGMKQTQEELPHRLKTFLEQSAISNIDCDLVVLVSPLTRCLETWYYGVRPLLPPDTVPTRIVPLLRERVYSASDTGRPWGLLQTECRKIFNHDDKVLSSLDWSLLEEQYHEQESWWYTVREGHPTPEEWRPCSEQQYYAVPGEPQEVFEERLQSLEEWLRNEYAGRTIVLVTHWGVLRHFTKNEVGNCGICHWKWDGA